MVSKPPQNMRLPSKGIFEASIGSRTLQTLVSSRPIAQSGRAQTSDVTARRGSCPRHGS
jgi:hypothetical protein